MFVEDAVGQLVFFSHRRNYLIGAKLWEKIRQRYGSTYALEIRQQSGLVAYKAAGDIMRGRYEEIKLAEEDSRMNTEEEYLPTEKDTVFPIRPGQTASPSRRQSDDHVTAKLDVPLPKGLRRHIKAGSCAPAQEAEDDYAMESVESVIDERDRECVAPALGLRNYGENCYVNAGLQCLLCVPEMNAYFMQARYKNITYPTKKRGFVICEALNALYKSVFDPSGPTWVAPKGLLTLLPSGQQDTHELFWRKLFPMIQDETNPRDKKARKEDLDGRASWNWYRTQHNSILDAMFAGQVESQVICKTCGHTSTAYDPFFDLSLTLSGDTLDSCLASFFEDEALSKKAGYRCGKCKKVCAVIKKTKIDRCPRYLMIHLKRLVGNQHKISDYIEYGHQLDLSSYCAEKAEYKLAAVCIHNGTASGGHNYAVGKRGDQVCNARLSFSGICLTTSRQSRYRRRRHCHMRRTCCYTQGLETGLNSPYQANKCLYIPIFTISPASFVPSY